MEFETVRNALRGYLHQDYDITEGTLADALLNAVKDSKVDKFLDELKELATRSDDVVADVLDDHDVYLWDIIQPRDFLVTLRTVAELYKFPESLT